MDRDESVRSILRSHNVLNIFQNYDFHVGQIMHKAVNNHLPESLKNILTIENPFFYFKKCRIKQTQKSLSFAGPKIWNDLPFELIEQSDFHIFKHNLKISIFGNST